MSDFFDAVENYETCEAAIAELPVLTDNFGDVVFEWFGGQWLGNWIRD